MNDVIIIYESDHGNIGVAADYKSAIYYLFKEGWIDDYTDAFDDNNNKYMPISEVFGKDWRMVLLNANENWFNDKFTDQFGLEHVKIYKYE